MTTAGHGRQTYLYGPTLHMRAVEREDAASEPSWRNHWFPRALAVSEANIEDEFGADALLVAVRNCDGVILGSVAIETDSAWRQARPFVARWLDPARADAVEAEIAELILPFLVDEGGAMTALIEIASGKPLVEAALTGSAPAGATGTAKPGKSTGPGATSSAISSSTHGLLKPSVSRRSRRKTHGAGGPGSRAEMLAADRNPAGRHRDGRRAALFARRFPRRTA